jgi:transposase
MDQFVYTRLLDTCMKPVYERVQDTLGDATFMQDNAPVHKAYSPMIWLTANDIKLEDWPPYSPDMNPIEHVWKRLKDKLHTSYPNLANTRGGPEAVRARLAEVLPRVWEGIEQDFLENLTKSMVDRVEALIEAEGWYTKY